MLRQGWLPSWNRISGENTFISSHRASSSLLLVILEMVVYPPTSECVTPKPLIARESVAGITDPMPSSSDQSTWWSPVHIIGEYMGVCV